MGVCHHGLGGNESHSSQASVAGRAMGFLCHLTAIVGSDLTLFFLAVDLYRSSQWSSFQKFWEVWEVGAFIALLVSVK